MNWHSNRRFTDNQYIIKKPTKQPKLTLSNKMKN